MEDLFKTLGEITKPEKESNNGSKQQAVEWLKENLHNAKDAFTQAIAALRSCCILKPNA